uniref:LY6/PLAUR domain containing 6 n=1 Tax=Paramormyrops kingsleyae TaxID=1676925 RepID=A0A3B3SKW4_9TELE
MEPSPHLAWVLLLSLIADWSEKGQSRDFTVNDIVYLHPSTTPFPGGFKCFTCEDAADNYSCNRWARDVYCPRETRYCYTHHRMDARGDSVSVTKRCVALEDCLSAGCRDINHEGHKVRWGRLPVTMGGIQLSVTMVMRLRVQARVQRSDCQHSIISFPFCTVLSLFILAFWMELLWYVSRSF